MNSRRLWKLPKGTSSWGARHQGTFWNSESQKCHFHGFSRGIAMLFCQIKTRNNDVKMSQAFHDIARFKRFTDLNLFKYAFNVIQNWEADALPFYWMVLIFCYQLWYMKVAGWGSLTSRQFWPATGPYWHCWYIMLQNHIKFWGCILW